MHDLNMISKRNEDAVRKARELNPAKHYVVEKSGLHVVRTDAYDDLDEALKAIERRRSKGMAIDASLHIVS